MRLFSRRDSEPAELGAENPCPSAPQRKRAIARCNVVIWDSRGEEIVAVMGVGSFIPFAILASKPISGS